MSKALISESYLTDIADAIREKLDVETQYKPSAMAAAIEAIPTGFTPAGSININQNGTTDVTDYASAVVNVPNSYAASDEGKVVSNGALVAQTSQAITQNGTYDTTLKNEVTVNVEGGGGGSSDFLYGSDEPAASLGSVGDVYIQCDGTFPYDSTEQRTYVLNITAARRGDQSIFGRASASEIDLIFVDSAGVEHSIRDISDFSYSADKVQDNPISYAFDGDQSTHWEGHNIPITITMTATIPMGYAPSALKVVQRSSDSYTSDVWKSFTLTETTDDDSVLLIERSDMTVADWAGAYEWTVFDISSLTAIAAFKKVDATTWEKTTPAIAALTVTKNGTYTPQNSGDGYAPVTVNIKTSSEYAVSDITHEGGGQGFYSNISSPGNGGNAPSGTTQIISSSKPVDLTELTSLKFTVWNRTLDTNTSQGMRFGVSQTVPQTWAEVTAARYVFVDSNNAKDYSLDVSDLSGEYYMFYAAQITYNNNGRAIAVFMFPNL